MRGLRLFMVVITALVVLLRYGFSIGFIWMQESVRFMYAAVFLLCAGYTLLEDKHVRVDVFYLKMSERKKSYCRYTGYHVFIMACLLCNTLFLLELCIKFLGSLGRISGRKRFASCLCYEDIYMVFFYTFNYSGNLKHNKISEFNLKKVV